MKLDRSSKKILSEGENLNDENKVFNNCPSLQ